MAAATTDATTTTAPTGKLPVPVMILAGFSFLLAIITGIPQFYYVLFGAGLVHIGPHSDFIGQLWYQYVLNGEAGYDKVDPGALAGAVLDAFLLAPLYFATGVGLLRRSSWVRPVGLMTGAMIFYAILFFFFSDIFASFSAVTDVIVYWVTSILYLIYPIWLIATLLLRPRWFKSSAVV